MHYAPELVFLGRVLGFEKPASERPEGRIAKHSDAISKKVAPHKHGDPEDPVGPNIITHERVLGNFTVKTPFGTFNANPSELHSIRPQRGKGTELIQVVDLDNSTGWELVFWRFPLFKGWRIELQGPGVYGGPGGTPVPLGARAFGIGLTRDAVDENAKEAVSVTIELKLMHDDIARLAGLVAPGVAAEVASAISAGAESGAAAIVGQVLAGAVPVISALIAVSTARWAYKTCKDPNARTSDKVLAVAHAISDAVRVVFPIPGVIANVALVGISLGLEWWRKRRQKKEQEATPPTGPPLQAEPA